MKQFLDISLDQYVDTCPANGIETQVRPFKGSVSLGSGFGWFVFASAFTSLYVRHHARVVRETVMGSSSYGLERGMVAALPNGGDIHGEGLCIRMHGYRPPFTITGPLEDTGRLRYIDGCTDSLLIPPVKKGDPCFNALYFPPGIDQTAHTHPSLRAGLIVSGSGICRTPGADIPLVEGMAFVIETDGLHAFKTERDSMLVVAYHPDSDFGAEDRFHPMINRTIVGGISANAIPDIQTK